MHLGHEGLLLSRSCIGFEAVSERPRPKCVIFSCLFFSLGIVLVCFGEDAGKTARGVYPRNCEGTRASSRRPRVLPSAHGVVSIASLLNPFFWKAHRLEKCCRVCKNLNHLYQFSINCSFLIEPIE